MAFSGFGLRGFRSRVVISALAATVIAGLAPGVAAAATESGLAPLTAPPDRSIPVSAVANNYHSPPIMPEWKPSSVAWPSGSADVQLSGTTATAAGALPVKIARTMASDSAAAAKVSVASPAAATALGVPGVVLSVQRTDKGASTSRAHVSLDYKPFRDAYGGDWAARLQLFQLPACALTTPDKAQCRTRASVRSANDGKAGTLSADVSLPAHAPAVFAAEATADSGGGDYSATSLQPSGSWQAGGSTDSFDWSYPIPVPTVPGGLAPKVALSYDSQSVDGLTSSTNNQPSWIGDGWGYSPGFIERSYQSCHQNPAGATRTWDNCWSDNTQLTLSLNGSTTTLIRDDHDGTYHPQADNGDRVQYETDNGEHFVVTTTDGTQYFFGLNKLPGFDPADKASVPTNSVLSEPVYATKDTQPCYDADFTKSHCKQPYRWNVDYVKDTHNDVVSYFYTKETNSYAAPGGGGKATADYDRGSYLTKIQYGQRDGEVYKTQPAAQVLFTSTGRCKVDSCDPAGLSKTSAGDWPDVPFDLNCKAQDPCQAQSPSFWSEYALQTIQTQALVGGTETTVDQWSLKHEFPATDDATLPALWLSSIKHTGQDTTAGGSSAPIDLPVVSFAGTSLTNRVNLRDGISPITRQRLTTITTETGETITVGYSQPSCGTGTPDPASNHALCFPSYWTLPGVDQPTRDWFNKYIVTGVTEKDATGGATKTTIETHYTPVGTPAWTLDDNPLTPADQRTWNQWRGYGGMIVTKGTGDDPVTKTESIFYRGIAGDTLLTPDHVAGVRTLPAATDAEQFISKPRETVVYNGDAVVSDTVNDPWTSAATATHALSGELPAQHSYQTGITETKVFTPLADGTVRGTRTSYGHDDHGRVTQVDDQGDISTPDDDLCTTTSYDDNTDAWILDKPAEAKSVSVNCATTPSLPDNAISDTLTYYDNATSTATPPKTGDLTMTQQVASYTGGQPNTVTLSTTKVDQYGRPTQATNADGKATITAYSPATGAQPTTITVTDPKGLVGITTFDPLRALTLSKTDPAGYVTTTQYDALGRLTSVHKPGVEGASLKYSYTVNNTSPSIVDVYTLGYDGSYQLAQTLYDSMLRARETQTQTPDNGRLIKDTTYNSLGLVSDATDAYYNSDPVSTDYVQAADVDLPSTTGTAYDGAGRKTAVTAYNRAKPTWSTTYAYGGDYVTTTPPAGTPPTTAISDARGHTTDLLTYHKGVPADPSDPAADFDRTRYTFYPSGKQHTVLDAAGNTWSYQYNLLGQNTSATDPDTGTATTSYTYAGLPTTLTDARGKQTTTQYDDDGRKTAVYDTTATQVLSSANKIASLTYDSVAKGYPTSSTSVSNGDTFTSTVLAYNDLGKVGKSKITLTGEGTALIPAAGLTTGYLYSPTGFLTDQNDAAVDGLPTEDVSTGYDKFGSPTSLVGTIPVSSGIPTWTYVQALGYTHFGEPTLYTMPASGGSVSVLLGHDEQTRALTEVKTTDTNASTFVDDLTYNYSAQGASPGAGLVTSTVDKQNGGALTDTQCYAYDYATRLAAAWTATDNCGNTPSPGNSPTVGGPAPYWQSWTYDAASDRTTQVDHNTAGNTGQDNTTTYHYDTPGQPHTLSGTTATGPNAAANTGSYHYDPAGNTTGINGGPIGDHTLSWNDQGKLASDTTAAGATSYVYDADGNLVVRKDPGKTTLFAGDEELVLDTTTHGVSGTRYYTIGGATVGVRSSTATNPSVLVPDRQGTDQLTIDCGSYTVTRRQFLPFGSSRGAAPSTWPGDLGYVGGTQDPATQLENLGAREYDAATGRFLSADPKFEQTDPNQMNGYGYAGADPVTRSDPSGLVAGSWCVTSACAGAGNSSPGLSGYGIDTGGGGGGGGSPAPSGPTYRKVSPHVMVQVGPAADRLQKLYDEEAAKIAPLIKDHQDVSRVDEGIAWADICRQDRHICDSQLSDVTFLFKQGNDDEQLVINSCAVEGGCGEGSSGIFMDGKENVPIADSAAVGLPASINVQAKVINEDDLAAQARQMRNDLAFGSNSYDRRKRAFIGAYDIVSGKVVAACSGNGNCAETNAIIKLGVSPDRIRFVEAYGFRPLDYATPNSPRVYQQIPTCTLCQLKYEQEMFPPGTEFEPNGKWSGGGAAAAAAVEQDPYDG